MPAFVALPANPEDLEAIARAQHEACASDPGFSVIFPKGPTAQTLQHGVARMENEMQEDPTSMFMIAKDAMSGEVAAYAVWHFFPLRSHDQIEREMLTDKFPLPADANIEAGNKLIHLSIRKRHEMVAKHIGMGLPYACKFLRDFTGMYLTRSRAQTSQPWEPNLSIRDKVLRLCWSSKAVREPTTTMFPHILRRRRTARDFT